MQNLSSAHFNNNLHGLKNTSISFSKKLAVVLPYHCMYSCTMPGGVGGGGGGGGGGLGFKRCLYEVKG